MKCKRVEDPEELPLVRCTDGRWLKAQQYLYEAEVYHKRGEYLLAVSYARAALVLVQKFSSSHHITRITKIYQSVKVSPYGKSGDVRELGEILETCRGQGSDISHIVV